MNKLRAFLAFAAASIAAGSSSLLAAAAPREIEITANDQMKFSLAAIEAKAGEQLKVTLKNIGTLPKEAMGHNWVLLKPGTDLNAFAMAAMTARRLARASARSGVGAGLGVAVDVGEPTALHLDLHPMAAAEGVQGVR